LKAPPTSYNPPVALSCEELVQRVWEALDEEDFDEAEACGRRALMVDPSSVEARLAWRGPSRERSSSTRPSTCCARRVALAPEDPEVRIDLGIALFEHCEFREAEGNLARAVEMGVDSPDASYWTALAARARGDFEAAEKQFARAHELDPVGYPLPRRMTQGNSWTPSRRRGPDCPGNSTASSKTSRSGSRIFPTRRS